MIWIFFSNIRMQISHKANTMSVRKDFNHGTFYLLGINDLEKG